MTPGSAGILPEHRTAAFYSTLFLTQGVWTVLGSIWLAQKGLSSGQIGVIASAPVFIMLVLNLVVGRIADRAKDWRQVIVFGSVCAGILPIGLLWAETFWTILPLWTLGSIAHASAVPVVDAAAMRLCQRNGKDFGAIRAWATVGYLAMLMASGFLARSYGVAVFLPLFLGGGLVRAAASLLLPQFRAAKPVESAGAKHLRDALKLWFVLPLLGWAIVFSTHLILNSFQNLLWQRQGIPLDLIGVLIAVGAGCETIMFFVFKKFSTKYPARLLILASGVISVVRWIAMGFEPGVPILFFLQTLHAITYAMGFLACVTFIAKWTSEDIAAEAQSFFVVLQQGCAVLALYGFGLIADTWGAQAYFFSAIIAAFGAGLIGLSMVLKHPEKAS